MKIDFKKGDGLVPVIIQDYNTQNVLMLGYMNKEAWDQTKETKKVTFYSRSKNRLWVKGEKSGNFLNYISSDIDCDKDTILIQAIPEGPTCHTGTKSCFGKKEKNFLFALQELLNERKEKDIKGSYTSKLFRRGINKIAQKVGEEAVELVIEAKDDNKDLFIGEAADLLFHYIVLLEAKEIALSEVIEELKSRDKITKKE